MNETMFGFFEVLTVFVYFSPLASHSSFNSCFYSLPSFSLSKSFTHYYSSNGAGGCSVVENLNHGWKLKTQIYGSVCVSVCVEYVFLREKKCGCHVCKYIKLMT